MPKRGWSDAPLESLVTLQRGFDITRKEQEPGPYEVISSSGPNSTHSDFKVAGPGVVIGRKGTLGTVFYSERAYWPHDTTLWVKDFHGNDPKFCYYFLRTMGFERFDCGASNPTLNRNHVHQLPIRYPPVTEQARIAEILSAYDDLIGNNTRRIKILEEMAQMLYREWFVNFRFPGHEKVRMVESESGPIPEGWTAETVSRMAIVHREAISPANFPDELFLHFSIPSFDNSRTPVREKGAEIKSSKYRVVPGCVLLSKLNPRILRVWMPSSVGGLREITSTEFLVLTPPIMAHRTYLFQLLSSEKFSGSLTGLSLGTSTSHQRVKPDDFLKLPSILPPRPVLDEFCRNVDPMMGEVSTLRSKNINLRRTRDFLLPKLISGEIRVEAASGVEQPA